MVHKLILSDSTSFEDAVYLLDKNGNGFLPIVDANEKLLGIITDGDIRRAILKKTTSIREIMNSTPMVARVDEPRKAVTSRLIALKRRHMPLVDAEGKYVDVIVLNDFNEKIHDNVVVIMAGGLGTRLGELTRDLPKPMLKVKGKPILQTIIENFATAGFHQFILCLNYKSEIIQDYFGNGDQFNVSISYTIESKRLGTAGALSLIEKAKLKKPFLVTNGDILTSLNFEDLLDAHSRKSCTATMCVKQHTVQLPYANVISDEEGNLINLEEKPSIPFYINAGIYVLDPAVLSRIPYNEYYDMPTLFHELKKEKEIIRTFLLDDHWVDIGLPQDFNRVNNQ